MVENVDTSSGPGRRIYLDHVGGAPWRPGVAEALAQASATFAHPSSPHREGQRARALLEAARTRSAAVFGCPPRELVFTSGATEALGIGLVGLARARAAVSRRVLVPVIEHVAITAAAARLAAEGFEIVPVPVRRQGRVDPDELGARLAGGAAAGALMAAHHETGVRQPLEEAGALFAEAGVPWVCDAALAAGRIPFQVNDLGAPICAWSGSKVGAPAGLGWLRVQQGTRLERSPSAAGVEEEGLRGGHIPVMLAAAGAVALEDAARDVSSRAAALDAWIEQLIELLATRSELEVIGVRGSHLPGVRTLRLGDAHGDALATALDVEGIAVASGSPCALGGTDPQPGLLAMGYTAREAASTVRISIGNSTIHEDASIVATAFVRILERLDALRAGHGSSRR
ncbi:MAG: cysteine desulfurase family protein [Planctomycetota bacterium]